MKNIYLSQTLADAHASEIYLDMNESGDFKLPNSMLVEAKSKMHPEGERFIALNYDKEPVDFLNEQLMLEAVKTNVSFVDGFVVDQVFTNDYHGLNFGFLRELSVMIGDKAHLIVGPSFCQVPSFLQSKIVDELIRYDVSGVMYNLREVSLDDYKRLQALAKLLMHVKKRTVVIPLVNSLEDAEALRKIMPVTVVAVG